MLISLLAIIAAPFVGSLLGAVIERLPEGRPILERRPTTPLRHGLPLGAVDLAAMVVAVWAVLAVPPPMVWPTVVLGWTLLALAEIDRRHLFLPDLLTIPLLLGGLVVAASVPGMSLGDHLIGACAGGATLAALGSTYRRLRGRDGLGLGDAKLFAAAGAWVGWPGLPSVLLIAAAGGLGWALLRSRIDGDWNPYRPFGFGPFLAAGCWTTWIHGPLVVFST